MPDELQENQQDIIIEEVNKHLDENYITPGAKKYFKRVTRAYVLLAIATVAGIWAFTNRSDRNLRHDINTFASISCKSQAPVLKKFNVYFDAQIQSANQVIQTQKDARAKNIQDGMPERANINQRLINSQKKFIKSIEDAKLHAPTVEECNNPILK